MDKKKRNERIMVGSMKDRRARKKVCREALRKVVSAKRAGTEQEIYIDMSPRRTIEVVGASRRDIIAACERALTEFKTSDITVVPFHSNARDRNTKQLPLNEKKSEAF